MLSSNGITMKPTVSLSDLRISGNAPSNRMQLVLRSLLTVANVRQPDPEAFAYYKLCEAVREEGQRGETEGIRTAIDRIMFPVMSKVCIKELQKDHPEWNGRAIKQNARRRFIKML